MKDKVIKTLCIAYEVDDLDLGSTQGNEDLSRELTSNYLYWMKVAKVSLEVMEMDGLNKMFIYYLVILADTALTSLDDINNSWSNFSNKVESTMENFLKINKVNYKKLD